MQVDLENFKMISRPRFIRIVGGYVYATGISDREGMEIMCQIIDNNFNWYLGYYE